MSSNPNYTKKLGILGCYMQFIDFFTKIPKTLVSIKNSKSTPQNLFIFEFFPTYLHDSPLEWGGTWGNGFWWKASKIKFWLISTWIINRFQNFLFFRLTFDLCHNGSQKLLFPPCQHMELPLTLPQWSKSLFFALKHKWLCYTHVFDLRAKLHTVGCTPG